MKDLFLIRHGKYDGKTGNLTEWGKKQVSEVASQMFRDCKQINGIYLVSSDAPRAVQTSKIISKCFNLDDFLIDGKLHTKGEELSEKQIQYNDTLVTSNEENNVVIISGHYDTVHSYGEYFLNFHEIAHDEIEPETEEAVHINLGEKIYLILPR